MQYVGVDWGYRRAAWCAKRASGDIAGEGIVPADEDGLARLALELGSEVRACVEMMSGALWVRDRLAACGWQIEVADSRKVKHLAPLACKTDRVDARVLAELCRRDLVPTIWVADLDERALKERLGRRVHLVRLRTSAANRIFGLLTQWGLRLSLAQLRRADAVELLAGRSVHPTWVDSVVATLGLVDQLDERIAAVDRELLPLARGDRRVELLETIPGIGPLLGLMLATEIGDPSRFPHSKKLIGYAGLAPGVRQSGESSRTQPLTKAGSRTLRWAAVEAAQHGWRPTNPWHRLYSDVKRRNGGKSNPAKAAVARKVLIAAWHVLNRDEPFRPPRVREADPAPASSTGFLAA